MGSSCASALKKTWLCGAGVLLLAQTFAATQPDVADAAAEALEPVWLQIQINGTPRGTELMLRAGEQIWIGPELLEQWRLLLPAGISPRTLPEGQFVRLDKLPGVEYRIDESLQMLDMQVAVSGLVRNLLRPRTPLPPPQPAAFGSFLNYDLSVGQAASEFSRNGAFEWGVFGARGYTLTGLLAGDAPGRPAVVRLDTTWVIDSPQLLRSLRIGDGISSAGSFGRSRRFGGLQWGSNFGLQPGLVTFPLPAASGSATVPSIVDLYVDQVLRLRQEVPAGPFEISELPVPSGLGEAELVIHDALGNEQRLPYTFYASPALLKPGLRAWQYSLGLEREGFGQSSADYGELLFSASERRGWSENLSLEWHGEWSREQLRTAAGAIWLAPGLGTLQGSAGASFADAGNGWIVGLGLERRARGLSVFASAQRASDDYDAAALPSERTPRLRLQGTLGLSLGKHGSLALSWLRQQRFTGETVATASLGFNRNLGDFGFVSLSVLRLSQPQSQLSVSASLTVPLGPGRSVRAGYNLNDGSGQMRLDLQQSPPAGQGYGYRLQAEPGARYSAEVQRQGQYAVLRASLAQLMQQTHSRFQASGGLLWMPGAGWFASRPLSDSFAVVDVADFPGVRVYADNQWVTTTAADGSALVPRLRAFQSNQLRIEQADLPMSARIDSLALEAVPPARSGLHMHFAVQQQSAAVVRLVLDDGLPIPAGAEIELLPQGRLLPLGLDGMIYADQLAGSGEHLQLRWRGQLCEIPLLLSAGEELADLGVLTCTGVKR